MNAEQAANVASKTIAAAAQRKEPLVIVDSDTKAAAATAAGLESFALTSAYLAAKSTPPALLAALTQYETAIIVDDSNADERPATRDSLKALGASLRAQGFVCAYTTVPTNMKPKKRGRPAAADPMAEIDPAVPTSPGIDGWLAVVGPAVVLGRLQWLVQKESERLAKAKNGGFRALGRCGRSNFLWSRKNDNQYEIINSALASETELQALCGVDWCEAMYGETDKNGRLRVDYKALASDILRAIEQAGPFSPDAVRGMGVWLDASDESALVVNSKTIFRSDGAEIDRIGDYVYPAAGDLGVAKDTPRATVQQMHELLKTLRTWNFSRDSDAVMLLGWISLAYLCGALPWRPHLSVTGERGSGKSSLQTLIKNLLGNAAISVDGSSTAAGIRTKMQQNSIAILLDEAESEDGRKLAQHMNFFRTGSSGSTRLQSSKDQTSIEYTIRSIGMLSGIVPPMMKAADQSRFLFMQIKSVNKGCTLPHLVNDQISARDLGRGMFARTLSLWPRLNRAQQIIREVSYETLADTRSVDTLSPCIAAAWCQMNDGEMTAQNAREFIKGLDLEADYDRMEETKDHEELHDQMMSAIIEVSINGKTMKKMLSSVCEAAVLENSTGCYREELEKCGIVVFPDTTDHQPRMGIWSKSPGFRELFKGTKFASADLETVLRRLPMCEKKKRDKAVWIAGKARKILAMRLHVNESM